MNTLRVASFGMASLIVAGCGDGRAARELTAPALTASAAVGVATGQVQTSGTFDALVDFSTVTLTPKGQNCLLEVDGRLVFSGTIVGTAVAHTSALESAPCADVATNPPGTFTDVFRSEAVFDGTVDGQPAHANLLYLGQVAVAGHITGRLVFSNGMAGRLDADAQVAVGGSYSGGVVVQ